MKRLFCMSVCLLLCTLLLGMMPASGEEAIYGDVIRLHILAASDGEEDQALKLSVRDAILAEHGDVLFDCGNRATAEERTRAILPELTRTAEEVLRRRGCEDAVTITLTEEEYPTRDYDTFSLPAGTYLSLRVLIGEAAGQNWWCVLYPPLCLNVATDTPIGLTDAEWGLMSDNGGGKYTIKFKVLELLESAFR